MSTQFIKLCLGVVASAWLLGMPAGATGWLLAQNTDSQPAISADDQSPAAELSLWNGIKDSQNAQDYLDYLRRFPNGMFADPAKDRYEALSGQKVDPALIGGNTGPAAEPASPKTETATETKQPLVKRPVAKVQKTAKAQKVTKVKTATIKPTRKKTKLSASTKSTKKVAMPHKFAASKKLPIKRKQQVASKRKACTPDLFTSECVYATATPETNREMFGNRGGGNRGGGGGGGSSSGSGGGGTGGWH